MKIRKDFVTNSSSVSYIVTMNKEVADTFNKCFGYSGNKLMIFNKLKEIVSKGKETRIDGEKIKAIKVRFRTDGDCLFKDSLDKKKVSELSDEEILAYIYGAYLTEGKISEVPGFGATQTETF